MAWTVGHAIGLPGAVSMSDWWARYIGTPFKDGGRGADAVDCWGLVRLVYAAELGIDLPRYGEISARDLMRVARAMGAVKDDGWNAVTDPRAFDVALMRSGRGGGDTVVHVGLMIDARRVMHVDAATATTVVPLTHFSVAGRIVGFRRHPLLADHHGGRVADLVLHGERIDAASGMGLDRADVAGIPLGLSGSE